MGEVRVEVCNICGNDMPNEKLLIKYPINGLNFYDANGNERNVCNDCLEKIGYFKIDMLKLDIRRLENELAFHTSYEKKLAEKIIQSISDDVRIWDETDFEWNNYDALVRQTYNDLIAYKKRCKK